MSSRMVRYTMEALPVLTDEDRARLRAMGARSESEIDTSDSPELTAAQWANAERGKFYRPLKAQITAKVDKDVLAWLKADGPGYQSRLNAILRRAMLHARAT